MSLRNARAARGARVEVGNAHYPAALAALEDRIDWDQIVGAVHLDAVSGIVDDRDIGVARHVRELANGATDHRDSKIRAAVDHVKAGIAQQFRDGGGVIDRIGHTWDVLIGRIADHERNALVRKRAVALRDEQQDRSTFLMKALTNTSLPGVSVPRAPWWRSARLRPAPQAWPKSVRDGSGGQRARNRCRR